MIFWLMLQTPTITSGFDASSVPTGSQWFTCHGLSPPHKKNKRAETNNTHLCVIIGSGSQSTGPLRYLQSVLFCNPDKISPTPWRLYTLVLLASACCVCNSDRTDTHPIRLVYHFLVVNSMRFTSFYTHVPEDIPCFKSESARFLFGFSFFTFSGSRHLMNRYIWQKILHILESPKLVFLAFSL